MPLGYLRVVAVIAMAPVVGLADTRPLPPAAPAIASYVDTVRIPAAGGVWHQISHTALPTQIVDEYTPVNENDAAWTQIITVKTLPLSRDPAPIVQGTVGLMRDVCAKVNVVNVAHSQ